MAKKAGKARSAVKAAAAPPRTRADLPADLYVWAYYTAVIHNLGYWMGLGLYYSRLRVPVSRGSERSGGPAQPASALLVTAATRSFAERFQAGPVRFL